MARLTTKEGKKMPGSDIGLPEKPSKSEGGDGYPIEDRACAMHGFARVASFGRLTGEAEVMRKVHGRYPSIEEAKKKSGERGRGSRREGRGRERER